MTIPTDEEREKLVKHLADVNAAQFSQGLAYTNIIVAAGYAGSFALWNIVKEQLTAAASNWIVLALGISLVTFIAWNVFTMIWLAVERMAYGAGLEGLSGDAFIKRHLALEGATKRKLAGYYKIWVCQLTLTIVTAAIGMGILLVNCGANLLRTQ
jgi:hypothetical protein